MALFVAWSAIVGLAGYILRRALLPAWSGAPARLAEAVLFLALAVVEAEVLGIFGVFGRVGLIVAAVVGLAIAAFTERRMRAAPDESVPLTKPQPSPRHLLALSASAAAGLAMLWAGWVVHAYRKGIFEYDSLNYHLTEVARYVQTGSMRELHFTSPESGTQFHPLNSELLHGIGMALVGSDVLSLGLTAAFAALALVAAWCIGRSRGRAATVTICVAAALAPPVMLETQAASAGNDVFIVATVLAAAALALHGVADDSGLPGHLVAALAAGLAAGGKGTALAPTVVLVAAVTYVCRRRSWPTVLATWATGVAVTGSYFYLRNLAHTGNPFPIEDFGIGGFRLPAARLDLFDKYGFSVASYWNEPSVWRSMLLPGMRALGAAWPVVVVLGLTGLAISLRRSRPPLERALAVTGAAAVLGYLITPTGAIGFEGGPSFFAQNLRYVTPPLALGAALFCIDPLLASARRQAALAVVVLAAAIAGLFSNKWPATPDEGAAVGAIAGMLAIVVVVAVVAAIRARSWPTPVLIGSGVVAAAGFVLGASVVEQRYLDNRYRATEWAWAQPLTGARIAIAGFDRQYPLYGPSFENHVQYVGVVGEHGAFSVVPTCRAWRQELRRGRYDYVMVSHELTLEYGEREPPEAGWTESDPVAERIPTGGRSKVFRLQRAPSPEGCPAL